MPLVIDLAQQWRAEILRGEKQALDLMARQWLAVEQELQTAIRATADVAPPKPAAPRATKPVPAAPVQAAPVTDDGALAAQHGLADVRAVGGRYVHPRRMEGVDRDDIEPHFRQAFYDTKVDLIAQIRRGDITLEYSDLQPHLHALQAPAPGAVAGVRSVPISHSRCDMDEGE